MKIFLDSVDVNFIKKWADTSLVDGITTNPTLLSKAGYKCPEDALKEIVTVMGDRPVSIEVTEREPEKIYAQAHQIANIADNVVVKIPCIREYAHTIEKLVDEGIALNITLLFSVSQALMMAKLGVTYVSPFIGRVDDMGSDGLQLISDIREIYSNYEYETEILAASIRSVVHVQEVALRGADIATLPPAIFDASFDHPLTSRGVDQFLADWQKTGLSDIFCE